MESNDLITSTPLLVVISGPSGSGKTTICRQISAEYGWYYSISHTTRSKKDGETEGADYFFIEEDEFKKMITEGDFLEWANVYENYYGTSKKVIFDKLNQGHSVILDLDTQGAKSIKAIYPEAILIFIKIPSLDELEKRLVGRGRDSNQEIQKRLGSAEEELKSIHFYDHVVVNADLDKAIKDVKMIIQDNLGNKKQ